MPSVMPVAEPGNDFLDSSRFFLLCIKFYPWNCWSQILNVSAYISMIWGLKTTFWECVDNFEGIRTSVEGFGIQNCEDLVRMGGCEQGGAAFCCACSGIWSFHPAAVFFVLYFSKIFRLLYCCELAKPRI